MENKKMLLRVTVDDESIIIERKHYVTAKTRQLREFGYKDLTEQEVDEQITAALEGKELLKGLTVIGGFIKGEIAAIP